MAGKNQHHIPRFMQRGFAAPSDKHKIWRFEKNVVPRKPRSISNTGSEDDFYGQEVDAIITAQENRISTELARLRAELVGSMVDPDTAAELVDHLAPRAAHLRQTLERGLRQLISGAGELFSEQEKIEAIMGLDQPTPTPKFEEHSSKLFDEYPAFEQLGLPRSVLNRIAFQLAREQFGKTTAELLPLFNRLIAGWLEKSAEVSRTGHNKALSRAEVLTVRRQFLASLDWEVAQAPREGAVLPDCIAIALLVDGTISPLTLAGTDEIRAVVMPLATTKLLVGMHDGESLPPSFNFNPAAARASHRYFLAATNSAAIAKFAPLIDERSSSLVDEAVSHAFKDFVPASIAEHPSDTISSGADGAPTGQLQYQISLPGSASDEETKQIARVTQSIVNALAQQLPLNRLDGITFAADYPEALASIDRGIPGARAPTTTDPELATGIAQTINLVRDGKIKCRVVINAGIGSALVGEDEQIAQWALSVLVRQLDLVAITEFIDTAIPGVLLKPIADPLESWLYTMIGSAPEGYMAGHLSAGFGNDDETIDDYREVLAKSLMRALTIIPAERLAYRYHGDLDRLLDKAVPLLGDVLTFAADLLGYCAATNVEPLLHGSELDMIVQRAGLAEWLTLYRCDLEAIRTRLGRWRSFDEFTALTIHAERLMWQFGMIPWATDEGIRVEVPLATDAAQLQLA